MGRFDKYRAHLAEYLPAEETPKTEQAPPAQSETVYTKKTPEQIKFQMEQGGKEPGFFDKYVAPLATALDPSEMRKDLAAGAFRATDKASFGAIPWVSEKLFGTNAAEQRAFAESREGTGFGGDLASIGIGGALNVTGPAAIAGRNLVAPVVNTAERIAPGATKAIGASLPSARPIAESAVGSGLVGASEAAIKGGDVGDVAAAGGLSALVGGGMSSLPVVAGKVEDIAHRAVLNRSVKPITDVAKGKVDKALSQFGGGKSIEEGERNLKAFVDKENLQPVLRARGEAMEEQFQARKEAVWDQKLAPIYEKAIELEPKASVPIKAIKERLSSLVKEDQKGTSRDDLVKQYVKQIDDIAKTQKWGQFYPVRNLLNKARDLQGRGHSGVVNYDSPTENKELEREVGAEIRKIANARIANIFSKNPKGAAEVLGREPFTTKRPRTLEEGQENPDVKALGEQFAEGNKTYSDYSKLDPLVDQAAKNQARDRQPFTMRDELKKSRIAQLATAAGYALGGVPGAAIGGGTALVGMKSAPAIERGAEAVAGSLRGEAFNPMDIMNVAKMNAAKGETLSRDDIAKLMTTAVGVSALKEYLKNRKKK